MSRVRRSLYRSASALGTAEAVAKGRLPQRLARRTLWRLLGRIFR